MKKLASLLLSLPLCFLVACGDDNPSGGKCEGDECEDIPATCGNGVVDAGEDCDGTLLGTGKCGDADGYAGDASKLKCSMSCKYDYSNCDKVMKIAGNYDVVTTMDFGDLVPAKVNQAVQMLKNPKTTVKNLIKDQVCSLYGNGTTCQELNSTNYMLYLTAWATVEMLLNDAQNGLLDSYMTTFMEVEEVAALIGAATSLDEAIHNLAILSTLELSQKKGSADTVTLKETIKAANIKLTYDGCTSCSDKQIDLGLSNKPISYEGTTKNLTAAKPTITLGSDTKRREFTLKYGDLIMKAINEALIPTVTGKSDVTSISGLLNIIIDCNEIDRALASLSSTVKNVISTLCPTVKSVGGSLLTSELTKLVDLGEVTFTGNIPDAEFVASQADAKRAEKITGKNFDIVVDATGLDSTLDIKAKFEAVLKK